MIQAGADIDDINEEGTTALMYAASAGRDQCVKLLVDLGTDTQMINEDGYRAVDLAANKEVLRLLRYA